MSESTNTEILSSIVDIHTEAIKSMAITMRLARIALDDKISVLVDSDITCPPRYR